MKSTIPVLSALVLVGATPALAQQEQLDERVTPPPPTPPPADGPTAAPDDPGLPDDVPPAAPAAQEEVAPDPTGQWSYTSQYGWVWLPWAESYTYVAGDGGIAYAYAWYPAWGWRWIEAPWVLGVGPRPYWGSQGYGQFAWYSHPWFTPGTYRGGTSAVASAGGGGRSGGGWHGTSGQVHGAAPLMRRTGRNGAAPLVPAPTVGAAHAAGGRSRR